MQRSHKIKLIPSKTQLVALKKAAGCARYAYNWSLATWREQYALSKEGKAEKPDVYKISRLWTLHKPEWAYESPKDAAGKAVMNVGQAYINYWRGQTRPPVFKKKGISDSFYVSNSHFSVVGLRVKLPKIGSVRLTEPLRFIGKVMGGTVSCTAGDWFISISVELPDRAVSTNKSIVGVDVGIKSIAVASDGSKLENPKLLKRFADKLKHAQRVLARRQKGSARREKALVAVQKIHQKIVNIRQDAIHKFTTALAKNHGLAVIETLDVEKMRETGNRLLRCLLQDTAMAEVHRQLAYKMRTDKAPRFYPSSKMCSKCGHILDFLDLSTRVYRCNVCDNTCDRDLNASFNLRNMRWVTPQLVESYEGR